MPHEFLNPNQARHVGVSLGLLLDDVDALKASLPDDARAAPAAARLGDLRDRAAGALAQLGFPPRADVPPVQRLAGFCGVWLSRLEDLRAARLAGFGAVDPRLAGRLDPLIAGIRAALESLLKVTGAGGEGAA